MNKVTPQDLIDLEIGDYIAQDESNTGIVIKSAASKWSFWGLHQAKSKYGYSGGFAFRNTDSVSYDNFSKKKTPELDWLQEFVCNYYKIPNPSITAVSKRILRVSFI